MRLKVFKFSDYKLTVGQKRLLKLARLVDTIHPKQFSMENVMCTLGRGCGSAGCVLGWAGTLKIIPGIVTKRHGVLVNGKEVSWGTIGNAEGDWELVKFFGLEGWDEADYLFGPHVSTPIAKAAQIREFVQDQILNG